MGKKCQYLAKKTNFGPNLAVYGPKFLFFMGVSQSFVTKITEKPPRQLVRIAFWSAWDQMGQKGRYLAKNASFGSNLAVLGPKFHILGGWNKTFGILISGNQ